MRCKPARTTNNNYTTYSHNYLICLEECLNESHAAAVSAIDPMLGLLALAICRVQLHIHFSAVTKVFKIIIIDKKNIRYYVIIIDRVKIM